MLDHIEGCLCKQPILVKNDNQIQWGNSNPIQRTFLLSAMNNYPIRGLA
ncbi:hypothetical protein SLEP1_g15880 [Rubroshorea leprosula]|uniref:Uncharacterized protein n=1 Tax=Rubroshorea leprosula TaxID=152421 RepID=A0AAV5IY88_9ROSI|nr:hypothetical protein SLEP1_g15880 [Rubroshorea leprosula]